MTVEVSVIADSIGVENGVRLSTLELRYPRFVHAEFMTHRVFARNASSSRAIPTKRMHETILVDPAWPAEWRMNQAGMQGYAKAPDLVIVSAEKAVRALMEKAIETAEFLDKLGLHKQHVNRYTEPFQHIRVVVTSVYWRNFLELRTHPTAEPTMQLLASKIGDALADSTPANLERGEWHLPYIRESDRQGLWLIAGYPEWLSQSRREVHRELQRRVSAARCARVSYQNFEGKDSSLEEDIGLYMKLYTAPLHASPFEHQATPDWKIYDGRHLGPNRWLHIHEHGNLHGWRQWRKQLPHENLDMLFTP